MVSMNQLESGVARWMDTELMPKLEEQVGIKKVATVAFALYSLKRGRAALESLSGSSFLSTIGAVDNAGNVDIEGIAEEIRKQIPDAGLRVTVPMIGDLTFYRTDIDDMLRYIKS